MTGVMLTMALLPVPLIDASQMPGPVAGRTADEWRGIYADLLKSSNKRTRREADLPRIVPRMVRLYRDLDRAESLSHAQASRMQSRLKIRLEELRDELIRDNREREKLAAKQQRRSLKRRTNRTGDGGAVSLNGPREIAQANQLINLITSTIAPESWKRNGGKGSISYYDPLQVLVIRQRGEVHHQIGGTLGQIRKAP